MAKLESLLSLRQMRYFVSVVEQKGFTAAAEYCAVAQPSLSRHVAQLEAALGERLLVRSRAGVEPTEIGWKTYHELRQILERTNALAAVVHGTAAEPEGRVSVAVPATASGILVAELIRNCHQKYPQIELHINEGLSQLTNSVLTSGLVDFGIVPNGEELPDVVCEPILREWLYLARLAQEGEQYAPTVSLQEVAKHVLALPTREMHMRRYLEHAASDAGVRLNVRYEQRSQAIISAFVRAGSAMTIGSWPALTTNFDTSSMVAQRIAEPDLSRVFSLAYPAQRPLSQAARAVYELLKEVSAQAVKKGLWRGVLLNE